MKKLFGAILLIFCCNFMIVNVHATYKDDYLELMPKVVEILKESRLNLETAIQGNL